jgi:O-antigen ligase
MSEVDTLAGEPDFDSDSAPPELFTPTMLQLLAYASLWTTHLVAPLLYLSPIAVMLVLLTHLRFVNVPRRIPREVVIALLMCGYTAFVLLVHNHLFNLPLDELARSSRIIYLLIVFLLFWVVDARCALTIPFLRVGLVVGGLISFLSLYSLFVQPVELLERRLSSSSGQYAIGFFHNKNMMAGAMAVLCIGVLATFVHGRLYGMRKGLWIMDLLLASVVFAGFIFAKSRSFLLAFLCVILYLGVLRPRTRFSLRAFAISLSVIAVVLGTVARFDVEQDVADKNLEIRLQLYERGMRMMPESWLIGHGIGTFTEEKVTYRFKIPNLIAIRETGQRMENDEKRLDVADRGLSVHNSYLEMMLDFGLIGTVLLMLLVWFGVMRYYELSRLREVMDLGERPEFRQAFLNGEIFVYIAVMLLVAGIAVPFTLGSAPFTLLFYVCLARMITHSRSLGWDSEEEHAFADEASSHTPPPSDEPNSHAVAEPLERETPSMP